MNQDHATLCKLIVLYLLNRTAAPIAVSQIGDFFLEKEYMNFLTLQEVTAELTESGMITADKSKNRTYLACTDEGKRTLSYFAGRIPAAIRADIDVFLSENGYEMRRESAIRADYMRTSAGDYEVHMSALEQENPLVDLRLYVTDADTAETVCQNWREKSAGVYQSLIKMLF